MHGDARIIANFPFSIGRRDEDGSDESDLSLPDKEPFCLSRLHCTIERDQHGGYWLRDDTSRMGTIVNGSMIGGFSGRTKAPLDRQTNELILGARNSPHRFYLTLSERSAGSPRP